jgi:phosphate butyryltransferase
MLSGIFFLTSGFFMTIRLKLFVRRDPKPDYFIIFAPRTIDPQKQEISMLTKISQLYEMAKGHTPRRVVLAAAHEVHALEALVDASKKGIVEGILVGDKERVRETGEKYGLDLSGMVQVCVSDNEKAAEVAVKMVREGEGDILMKGGLSTACLMRAVLNREWGLRNGEMISHLALFELTHYHKILGLTDAAMNIAPDLKGKVSLINNAVNFMRLLGIDLPKVALLSAVETVNPDMKSSMEAAIISKMAERGQIKNAIIDGPLAFDNAISPDSAKSKGINSLVAGDADLLLADNIDMANSLYKSFIYFARAKCAAVILGAAAPIILTSRADSNETKRNSIALAAAVNFK